MNDTQKKLLARGVIVLPDVLEHSVYELFVEALVIDRPTDEIRVYCKGKGGDSRTAFAIVDLITQHGNVTGVLVGEAMSSHVPIWASCQRRYVSPHGVIGLHRVSAYVEIPIDSRYASLMSVDFFRTDEATATLLAGISSCDFAYWYDKISSAGNGGCDLVAARDLIMGGMALPLADLPPLATVTNS